MRLQLNTENGCLGAWNTVFHVLHWRLSTADTQGNSKDLTLLKNVPVSGGLLV